MYTRNYVLLLVVAPEREMFNEVYVLLCSVPLALALGTENYMATTTSTALCSMINDTRKYVLLLVVAPEREMFNEVYVLLCSVPLALGTENYTATTTSIALCSMINVCTV